MNDELLEELIGYLHDYKDLLQEVDFTPLDDDITETIKQLEVLLD
jgi:hypothetical protein